MSASQIEIPTDDRFFIELVPQMGIQTCPRCGATFFQGDLPAVSRRGAVGYFCITCVDSLPNQVIGALNEARKPTTRRPELIVRSVRGGRIIYEHESPAESAAPAAPPQELPPSTPRRKFFR